jgi:alanine racemase
VRRSLGLSGRAQVLVGGARRAVVGAVTMDLTMVETPDRAVTVGDVATLIGAADGDRITLDEYAAWGDALQREALTSLGPRLPRVYA